MQKSPTNSNRIVGVLLILLGLFFLVDRVFQINFFRFAWPLFIIIPGVLLYVASLTMSEEPGKGFSALGGIVTMVGLLLFYQLTFDHFQSWAYAWALVAPTSVGLAWAGYGLVRGNPPLRREGMQLAGLGLAFFVIGLIFFELIIGISGFRLPWARNLWPVLLILVGLALMLRNLWPRR